MGDENFCKKSAVVGLKILISKTGCIIRRVNFSMGEQVFLEENKKLHICSIINN